MCYDCKVEKKTKVYSCVLCGECSFFCSLCLSLQLMCRNCMLNAVIKKSNLMLVIEYAYWISSICCIHSSSWWYCQHKWKSHIIWKKTICFHLIECKNIALQFPSFWLPSRIIPFICTYEHVDVSSRTHIHKPILFTNMQICIWILRFTVHLKRNKFIFLYIMRNDCGQ